MRNVNEYSYTVLTQAPAHPHSGSLSILYSIHTITSERASMPYMHSAITIQYTFPACF